MSGISAFGTELRVGDGAGPEVFTPVAGVTNISGPGFSLDTIDGTAHDSPGAVEEVIPSIIRTGELTLDINYDPNDPTHDAADGLLSTMFARSLRNYQLAFPTSPEVVWTFAAYVTGFEPSAPYDDKLSASVTLRISGAPTLA